MDQEVSGEASVKPMHRNNGAGAAVCVGTVAACVVLSSENLPLWAKALVAFAGSAAGYLKGLYEEKPTRGEGNHD